MKEDEIVSIKQDLSLSENITPEAYTVCDVIALLEECSDDSYVLIQMGEKAEFSNFVTDSWRGSYDQPAIFEYDKPSTVKQCIDNLNLTDGKIVTGYKGGEYRLNDSDILFVEREYCSYTARAITGHEKHDGYILLKTTEDMY